MNPTSDHRPPARRTQAGMSLVELLVATAITLLGLLVITQVFAVYEGWKRTTTGVAQTQEGGLLGAFAIEQDLRNAGFGLIGLECSTINAYNAQAATSSIELGAAPVTIASDTPTAGNDRIGILYSSSPFANVAAKLQGEMATSAAVLRVDNGLGFSIGDMILLAQDSQPCALLQVSAQPVVDGQNVTSPGSSWKLPHDPSGTFPWNPPDARNIFPADHYVLGARVLNLGQLVDHRFYVEANTLRMDERSITDGTVTTYDLIPGVVGLRAQCQPDPCSTQPSAVRFGLIVKSGNRERDQVEQREVTVSGGSATIAYWPGDGAPTLALSDEERHYRYRVFHTVVPLKNILWNP